jgi:hypothetical protein
LPKRNASLSLREKKSENKMKRQKKRPAINALLNRRKQNGMRGALYQKKNEL